ncbi:MAG TPA: hypothetical protein VFX76_00080, partial [Roseiflexaceae bacterium]|nr:hypothetical protein [Roseiflexaceae bacterium]
MSQRSVHYVGRRLWRVWLALIVALPLAGTSTAAAAAQNNAPVAQASLWSDVDPTSLAPAAAQPQIVPKTYRTVILNTVLFQQIAGAAPLERTAAANTPATITLPLPDGRNQQFTLFESPIMEPGLASKFPEIKTYAGQGIDDPTASVRMDWTPQGFHAMILAADGTVFIDPYARTNVTQYISYYSRD